MKAWEVKEIVIKIHVLTLGPVRSNAAVVQWAVQ